MTTGGFMKHWISAFIVTLLLASITGYLSAHDDSFYDVPMIVYTVDGK